MTKKKNKTSNSVKANHILSVEKFQSNKNQTTKNKQNSQEKTMKKHSSEFDKRAMALLERLHKHQKTPANKTSINLLQPAPPSFQYESQTKQEEDGFDAVDRLLGVESHMAPDQHAVTKPAVKALQASNNRFAMMSASDDEDEAKHVLPVAPPSFVFRSSVEEDDDL